MLSKQSVIDSLIPLAKLAWQEDVGEGDPSSKLITDRPAIAEVMARQSGIYCGQIWVDALKSITSFETIQQINDGQAFTAKQTILSIRAPLTTLVTLERTLLNGIQTLSATSSATYAFVQRIQHLPCKLLDTRKTLPGMRLAQKYAVGLGGGQNHRLGLYDAIMLKENHQTGSPSLSSQISRAQRLLKHLPIIIEVETVTAAQLAYELEPKQILLDNFGIEELIKTVQCRPANSPIKLEASGNITLDNCVPIAATGVDYISTGLITKNVQAIDLSMQVRIQD